MKKTFTAMFMAILLFVSAFAFASPSSTPSKIEPAFHSLMAAPEARKEALDAVDAGGGD